MFYRAENQKQLLDAFTVYEKFFDYQENLLETKRNMLTSHLAKQEKIFEQNLKIVEAIDKKNDEFLEASRLQDEKLADNLDTVNGRFETRMETCRKLIGEIRSEENKISNFLFVVFLIDIYQYLLHLFLNKKSKRVNTKRKNHIWKTLKRI